MVIDLRTAPDVEAEPYGIPGARLIAPETLDDPHQVIPRNSEVVFYCAEPREVTSTRMALRLEAHEYRHVHPLSGGLTARIASDSLHDTRTRLEPRRARC